ncbi:DUF3618 domain-containing protein [Kribbella deserti]|uniref:DUF3618 domain-containing protein n=1 Tax=Kribbella deserti TaxID=1926257 RepID=A0ABV6QS73_9ACTN
MSTHKTVSPPPPATEEEIREDLEQTRERLATTVEQLGRQLNVPHRVKTSVAQAGDRAKHAAIDAGGRAKHVAIDAGGRAKHVASGAGVKARTVAMDTKERVRQNPKVAAVGGAVVVGVGAGATWLARRGR